MVAELNERAIGEARNEGAEERTPSSLRKLYGVFLQPTYTFQEINKRPTWLLALFGAALVRLAEMFLFFQPRKTPVGLILNFLIAAIPAFLLVLVCSGVFILALYLGGAETSFKKVFSVFAHTFFCYTFVTAVLRGLVLFWTPDKSRIDFQNLVVSNLGFLVDKQEHLALQYLATSIDLIVFYHLYLISLGLPMVVGRMSSKSVRAIVIAIWGVYIATVVAVKAIVA